MKLSILPLRAALKLVSAIVPKKSFTPILLGVKFEGGFLTASNDELAMRVPTGAKVPDCVVEYSTLLGAVTALTESEIGFDLTDVAAVLKSGRTRINVPILGATADFPKMASDPAAPSCTLTREHIERIYSLTNFASTDTLRPAMTGIYFDGIDVVSTDGFRLANFNINLKQCAPCVLPKQLFVLLNSFAKATDYAFHNGLVIVKKGEDVLAEIRFRCIDEAYPAWQHIVPELSRHAVVEFEREEMNDAIDVLGIGASKETQIAAFEFTKGGGITATASDIGLNKESSTAVTAYVKGLQETIKMGFNINYLAAAFKYVGGELVKGYINEPGRAAIFKNPEFKGYALVMPTMV